MVSLAVIVLIQGALPISVLAFSGVKGTLEDNAISIDARGGQPQGEPGKCHGQKLGGHLP